jgi:hypothetical protein
MESFIENFKTQNVKYKSLPFWAWNDKLEIKFLKEQIEEFEKNGFGGFFIHSREGLETPYLSEKWLEAVQESVDMANKLGLETWLYDEDRWPSGSCGGSVQNSLGDIGRCKGITIEVVQHWQDDKFPDYCIACYDALIIDSKIIKLRRLPMELQALRESKYTLLIARLEISEGSDWFNGEAPPDNLSYETVQKFLELTHERYKLYLGNEFFKKIKGVFTDEPSLHDRHAKFNPNRGWIPWSYGMTEYFIKMRSYDLLDYLPYIYFGGEKATKVRHDYWRTISERFREVYSGSIGDWCRENNLAFTGHFLQEDRLGLSSRVSGSIMPHYKMQDIPGVDLLGEQCDEYLTMKQCSSVVNQYDKDFALSESFGCTGWELTFLNRKWLADWQFALGINRFSNHMALYTLKGCAKRDYPPSFNLNAPWWHENKQIEDYIQRVSSLLSLGKATTDLLVLHPRSTAWTMLGCSPYGNPVRSKERDIAKIDEYGYKFNGFLHYLSSQHYEYDLGDEELIAEDARISASNFFIANKPYKALILYHIENLLYETFNLLVDFLEAGGVVIVIGKLPIMLEGELCNKIESLKGYQNLFQIQSEEQIDVAMERVYPRRVSIKREDNTEETSVLHISKKNNKEEVIFLANNDREKIKKIKLRVKDSLSYKYIYELDSLTGNVYLKNNKDMDNIVFQPCESRIFLFSNNIYVTELDVSTLGKKKLIATLNEETTVSRDKGNVLTLDYCRYRTSDTTYSNIMPVWQAQEQIRRKNAWRPIFRNGNIQRYRWVNTNDKFIPISLSFDFYSDFDLETCDLIVEDAENFSIKLNGKPVSNKPKGYFLDHHMHIVALEAINSGKNTIELKCHYKDSSQLEAVYLLGNFKVTSERVLVKDNGKLRLGDWTTQGYMHYPGAIRYHYYFDVKLTDLSRKFFLDFPVYSGTTANIFVNNQKYICPWMTTRGRYIDISSAIKETNHIEVEVISSLRNMLGPLHLANDKALITNDKSFTPLGRNASDTYNVYSYGLLEPIKIYIEEDLER